MSAGFLLVFKPCQMNLRALKMRGVYPEKKRAKTNFLFSVSTKADFQTFISLAEGLLVT